MPETLTDERRRAVEKAGFEFWRECRGVSRFEPQEAIEDWAQEPEGVKQGWCRIAEAALESVDYFPLLDVAEAAKQVLDELWEIRGEYSQVFEPLPPRERRMMDILQTALDRLAKSEEAKDRG